MNIIKNFINFINESLGVAYPTLFLKDPICDIITDKFLNFEPNRSTVSKKYSENIIIKLKYSDIKPYIEDVELYAKFPASEVIIELELIREKNSKINYPFMLGGFASGFYGKKEDGSKFKPEVKIVSGHSISLHMGINIRQGNFYKPRDYDNFRIKLSAVVLHELNHLYEYYNREFGTGKVKTSVTWASIGDNIMNRPNKIFKYWQYYFTDYIYQSELHEVRAYIQEAMPYVSKFSFEDIQKQPIWLSAKSMQNFSYLNFINGLTNVIREHNPEYVETMIDTLVKDWNREYVKLYYELEDIGQPKPEFIRNLTTEEFFLFWEKKIKNAGEKIIKGICRQYSNK